MPPHTLESAQPNQIRRDAWERVRRVLLRRIWLPQTVYAAVPWFYLGTGFGALAGGLFLPQGSWILPYLVLLAVAIGHAGVAVASMRQKFRAKRRAGAA